MAMASSVLPQDTACRFKSAIWDENETQARLWLQEIIAQRRLTALFQPVLLMRNGEIAGYEGLIRGPSDSPLHSPHNLFRAANENGLAVEVEHLCRQVVLESFARLNLPGKLFLNVSPECLLQQNTRHGETLAYIHKLGLRPDRIVIELTENQRTYDYNLLREAAKHYRDMGFEIAIDDLGEGFSSLRLWSELRPEYVKIDMHFIQGIDQDPVKLQFVSSIQQIAERSGTKVVAEGIETEAELRVIKDLGIAHGQGYYIARPSGQPVTVLPAEVVKVLEKKMIPAILPSCKASPKTVSVIKLLRECHAVSPDISNEIIYQMFMGDPELQALPVVKNGLPVGLVNRSALIDKLARPYQRELYGKKPCARLMDTAPLIVEKDMSIQELSHTIVAADRHHLSNGFIITDHGQYLGIGTGHDLVREITQMQISAARYANPLTMLPGNEPINEQIAMLLQGGAEFYACYCDLDHFKPFNDVFGYHSGDNVIQLTGKILSEVCDSEHDFIGHIGGDDFIILFQSVDWEARCQRALERFEKAILDFFSVEDKAREGYIAKDRNGDEVFYPLTSLSIGAVQVEPCKQSSHHKISAAAAEAKKQAKGIPGNSLFVERRAKCS
ncbi:MAG: GGDEF domain-containing protein [Gammaproteobacteria bacterium]|nr:GGDEF domain-containing protein [Gammaproteobacteria bacterium]MBU1980448.1 GGDEF domain-containing protein [Gammaproteobacteria bacterium]